VDEGRARHDAGLSSFGLSKLACSYRVPTLEVYVENNGRWQMAAHQSGRSPAEGEMGTLSG